MTYTWLKTQQHWDQANKSVHNGRNCRSQNNTRKLKHEAVLGTTRAAYLLVEEAYERLSFLGPFAKLQKATVNFDMSVCPSAWNNLDPNGRNFMKFYIRVFFENL
jgi:hypothetical protein